MKMYTLDINENSTINDLKKFSNEYGIFSINMNFFLIMKFLKMIKQLKIIELLLCQQHFKFKKYYLY